MKKKTKIYPWKMYFHVLLGMFFLLPTLLNAQNTTIKVSGIVTDSSNDPIFKGSDHTREYVPLLLYAKHFNHTGRLRDGDSFALIGATIVDNFGLTMPKGTIGTSILKEL